MKWCKPNHKALCCKAEKPTGFELDILLPELRLFDYRDYTLFAFPVAVKKEHLEKFDHIAFKIFKKMAIDLDFLGYKDWSLIVAIRLIFPDWQICKYLKNNKCSIYSNRPITCRFYPAIAGTVELLENPVAACERCCGLTQADLPLLVKEIMKAYKKFQPRLNLLCREHRKTSQGLISEAIGIYKDRYLEHLKETVEMAKRGTNKDMIDIVLSAILIVSLDKNPVKSLTAQIENLGKIIKVLQETNSPYVSGYKEYQEFLIGLREKAKLISA